jgi:hypothetical protein
MIGCGTVLVVAFLLVVAPTTAAGALAPSVASTIARQAGERMGKVEGQPIVVSSSELEAYDTVMGVGLPSSPIAPGLTTAPAERVVVLGRFTDSEAKSPRTAAGPPTGTLLELALDEQGDIVATHLANPSAVASAARRHKRARAASSWPCNLVSHCYDLEEWHMGKPSEKVQGSETDIATTEMVVPGWESGAFVDDEEWVSFPERENANGPWWVESGQEAGSYRNNDQLYWFWAYNNASGYHEGNPGWPEEGWVFNAYSMQSQLDSYWCVYVNGGNAGCPGGLLDYAKGLEVGGEYATLSAPVNNFEEQTNYTAVGGEVRPWNKAETYRSPSTCSEPFSRGPNYYPGNARLWVPC